MLVGANRGCCLSRVTGFLVASVTRRGDESNVAMLSAASARVRPLAVGWRSYTARPVRLVAYHRSFSVGQPCSTCSKPCFDAARLQLMPVRYVTERGPPSILVVPSVAFCSPECARPRLVRSLPRQIVCWRALQLWPDTPLQVAAEVLSSPRAGKRPRPKHAPPTVFSVLHRVSHVSISPFFSPRMLGLSELPPPKLYYIRFLELV